MYRRFVIALLVDVSAILAPAAGATEPEVTLAPHRAIYDLVQSQGEPNGGTTAARGRLAIEVQDTCDGHTTNQRFWTELVNAEGEATISDFSLSSWESKDGRRFRFQMKNEVDGETLEEYVGTATREGDGNGTIVMSKPEAGTIEMPPGTVFPNAHLVALIRHALNGDQFLSIRVFDGSGEDGLFETGGSIGRALPVEASDTPLLAPLKGLRSWHFRIAFFPLLKKAEEPQYEIGFRMYENGVSGDLVLDYRAYVLKGELRHLEMLPPGC
jgi:hypothetical protein